MSFLTQNTHTKISIIFNNLYIYNNFIINDIFGNLHIFI
jgi:hypothetical protein